MATGTWKTLEPSTRDAIKKHQPDYGSEAKFDKESAETRTAIVEKALLAESKEARKNSLDSGNTGPSDVLTIMGLMTTSQQDFIDALNNEASVRKTIIKEMGLAGDLQRQTSDAIFNASVLTAEYGIELSEVRDVSAGISENLNRNVQLSEEQLAKATLLNKSMGEYGRAFEPLIKQLDLLNVSFEESIELGAELMNTARMMGVNMDSFLQNMSRNMSMINTYNFADGVEGFGKMAAQATRLGLEMSTVSSLAEKVMDPEGAIELAANLQVVGGAVGDLADPFQLMYLATNDLEGLQDRLVGVGKDLAVFNEETGQISFPPTAQRQLRALADTLGMSKEEFAEMVKLQTKFEAISNQLNLSMLPEGEEGERLEEFIQSMAKVGEGGKFMIEMGDGPALAVEDLTQEDLLKLTEQMAEQELTVEDIQKQQLNVLNTIADNTTKTAEAAKNAGIVTGMEPGLIAEKLSDSFDIVTDEFKMGLSDAFEEGFGGLRDDITGVSNVFSDLENAKIEENEKLQEALDTFGLIIGELPDDIASVLDAQEKQHIDSTEVSEEDVYMPAAGYNRFIFDPVKKQTTKLAVGDELFAFRQPQSPMMNMGGEMNTNNNTQNEVKVTLDLPREMRLALDGQNMGNFNWRNLVANRDFIQTLKSVLASTNLATAPGPDNARSSEIFYMA